MGILFKTIKNKLYLDEIRAICNVISKNNTDIQLLKTQQIPKNVIESFLEIRNEARDFLKKNYNEDIDTFTREYYLNGGVNPNAAHVYILAIENGIIIGFQESWCVKDSDESELTIAFVHQEHRGKRIGKWLIGELIIEYNESFPHKTIFVTNTTKSNLSTLKTLSYFGFKDQNNNHAIQYYEVELEERQKEEGSMN